MEVFGQGAGAGAGAVDFSTGSPRSPPSSPHVRLVPLTGGNSGSGGGGGGGRPGARSGAKKGSASSLAADLKRQLVDRYACASQCFSMRPPLFLRTAS